MNKFIESRFTASLAVLIIYAIAYLVLGMLLAQMGGIALIVGVTILLCLAVSLGIVLFEHRLAGIISAAVYPFAVLFGNMFGTVDAETGVYSGWTKCLYLFCAGAAAAVIFFRVQKQQKKGPKKLQ